MRSRVVIREGVTMSYSSDGSPRPVIDRPAARLAGLIALLGTLFVTLVVLPGTSEILTGLSAPVAFGVVLLLTTAVRLIAGVIGARRQRGASGTERRSEAMPSVLLGVALGWLGYEALALLAAHATGQDVALARMPLEGLRWLAEAALGAFIVQPGPPQTLDPRVQRFVIRSGRQR
jgi:hypothetical protein